MIEFILLLSIIGAIVVIGYAYQKAQARKEQEEFDQMLAEAEMRRKLVLAEYTAARSLRESESKETPSSATKHSYTANVNQTRPESSSTNDSMVNNVLAAMIIQSVTQSVVASTDTTQTQDTYSATEPASTSYFSSYNSSSSDSSSSYSDSGSSWSSSD